MASSSDKKMASVVLTKEVCIRGRMLTEPVWLPTETVNDDLLVRVNARTTWFSTLLTGLKKDAGVALAFRSASAKIRGAYFRASASDSSVMPTKKKAKTARASGFSGAVFDIDPSDSDAASGREPKTPFKLNTTELLKLQVGDHELEARFAGKTLLVRADATNIEALASIVMAEMPGAQEKSGTGTSADEAAVRFRHDRRCFVVTWKDEAGNRHRSEKGLSVPLADLHGTPLSPEAIQLARKRALKRACQLWNLLGKSGAPHIDLGS